MNGGEGNDTYIYNIGDGLDTISDYQNSSTESRNDKIKFGEGIKFSDLTFRQNGNDLIITLFNDITQGIVIKVSSVLTMTVLNTLSLLTGASLT